MILLLIQLLILKLDCVRVNKFYNEVYGEVSSFKFCATFNNEEGPRGCSSGFTGVNGHVLLYNSEKEVKNHIKTVKPGSYIALLDNSAYTADSISHLVLSKYVKGILIGDLSGHKGKPFGGFSPDSKKERSFQNGTLHAWNPLGSGLLQKDFGIPIFHLNQNSSVSSILQCYGDIVDGKNSDLNLLKCGVEMNSFMFSANQSVYDCQRKAENVFLFTSFCDSLTMSNLFASSHDLSGEIKDAVLISAQIDSKSMFITDTSGVESSATGLIAFLGVMETITSFLKKKDLKNTNPIIFSLFSGEYLDQIGSKAAARYLKNGVPFFKGATNISLKSIERFIHFDHLGFIQSGDGAYIHTNDPKDKLIEQLLIKVDSGSPVFKLSKFSSQNINMLPPSPLDSFISEGAVFKGVIFSDFDTEYKNKYFSSLFDDNNLLDILFDDNHKLSNKNLRNKFISFVLATSQSILKIVGVPDSMLGDVNKFEGIDDYFYCLLENANCSFFRKLFNSSKIQNGVISRQMTIETSEILLGLFKKILGFNFGVMKPEGDQCCIKQEDDVMFSFNITGGCVCKAPVFVQKIPNKSVGDGSKKSDLPFWAESVWEKITLKYFHYNSKNLEIAVASVGCITTTMTVILGIYLPRILKRCLT